MSSKVFSFLGSAGSSGALCSLFSVEGGGGVALVHRNLGAKVLIEFLLREPDIINTADARLNMINSVFRMFVAKWMEGMIMTK